MEKAIYSPNTASITRFLAHIQSAGTPTKLTQAYLKSVGFKSGNDSYLIPIMKALGFVDQTGTPTDRWKDYRNKARGKEILGGAVASAYSDLYQTYPDAHRRDNDALRNFFSTHYSKLSENTLGLVVRTFKVLADHSSFDASDGQADSRAVGPAASQPGATPAITPRAASAPDVHIDIQIHIPATATNDQIDQIFASMATHLYGRV
jgi:uncharacterized protein DUF5343